MEPIQILDLNDEPLRSRKAAEWLAATCTAVVWSNVGRQPLIPGLLQPWEALAGFKVAMTRMEQQKIGSYTDAIEYGHQLSSKSEFRHYRFHLEGAVRETLLQEGPLVSFPGLWDPLYYQSDKLVAAAICHERLLLIWDDVLR